VDEPTQDAATPRNELEAAIAGIWQEVLGLPSVGVHDDFFELGGHSLLAATLASSISDLMHVDFRVRDVEDQPTIASQAEAIARALIQHGAAGLLADAPSEPPVTTPRRP
jgi:hypothetical protein